MQFIKVYFILLMTLISSIFLSCAFDLAHVNYSPVDISICSENCPSFTILEEQHLKNLPCGYSRTLKKNSEWILVGTIEAGEVYKPRNQCFTIECSNIFEAYLVTNNDELNGFYLPVEDGYVALDKPIIINRSK